MRTAQQLVQEAQERLDSTPIGDSLLLMLAVTQRDAMQMLVEREYQEAQ